MRERTHHTKKTHTKNTEDKTNKYNIDDEKQPNAISRRRKEEKEYVGIKCTNVLMTCAVSKRDPSQTLQGSFP